MRALICRLGLIVSFALFTAVQATANQITVTSLADDGGAGELRAAIIAANSDGGNDSITFASGLTGRITLTSALPVVTASMTIQASGIAIDGAGQFQPFSIAAPGGTVTMSGLEVQNGNADIGSENTAGTDGGGIFVGSGSLSLTNCIIQGNSCSFNGGAVWNNAVVTLADCALTGNNASTGAGGGLYNNGTATLTNCTLSGNSSSGGGGVFNDDFGNAVSLTMLDCTLSNNAAPLGAGALSTNGHGPLSTIALTNCTLTGNVSTYGGGIWNTSAATITNCTISGNTAGTGGGIYAGGGSCALTNCVFYGDSGGEVSAQSTVTAGYCDIAGGVGGSTGITDKGGNIGTGPLLGPLSNNGGLTQTMALLSGSPCIQAGTATGAPFSDQRAVPRPNPPSMGAWDVGGDAPASNLQLITVHAPTTATPGLPIAVSYAVQNQGEGGTNLPWTDELYLSTTPDPAHVVATLGGVPENIVLPAGQSYTNTTSFTVPTSVSGNLYVVVVTGSGAFGASPPVAIAGAGNLWLSFNVPYISRANRPIVGYFSYGNNGQSNIPAPLLLLSIHDGSQVFRLSEDDPWMTSPIQVVGIGPDPKNPSVIEPGQSQTVPFYFNPMSSAYYHFSLSSVNVGGWAPSVKSSDDNTIPWATIEQQVQPANINPEAWNIIWNNFVTLFGPTWQSYYNALLFLASSSGIILIVSPGAEPSIGFELDMASGDICPQSILAGATDAVGDEPGFPLVFSRVAPVAIDQRFSLGPLGFGWANSFEYTLATIDSQHMDLEGPGGAERLFSNVSGTGWQGEAGDYGVLVQNEDGTWTLTEKGKSTMGFSAQGDLTAIADTHGNTVTPVYTNGMLTQVVHSNGDKLIIAYDGNGRITSITDPVGRVTTYAYDSTDQFLTTVTESNGQVTSYAYNSPTGAVSDYAMAAITFPDGTHLYYQYDAEGRLSGHSRDGGAQQTTYSYSGTGTVTIADAAGDASSINFGIDGEPLDVTDATARSVQLQFDDRQNLTSITAPDGSASLLQYDTRSNLSATTDALGNTSMFGADPSFDSLSWFKDANSELTSYGLDGFGDNVSISYPDGTENQFGFDTLGNVISSEDRSDTQIAYTYDTSGRVLTKTYQSGRKITYSYDNHGNLLSAADTATGTIVLTYDAFDRLTKIAYSSGHWLGFGYDSAGRRSQRTSDSGFKLDYGYDTLGRLSRVTDGSGNAYVSYAYDSLGRLSQETKGNGSYTIYGYDSASRISGIVNYSPGGSIQSEYLYTFDTNGNRASETTLAGATTYAYDKTGQLTGATLANGRTLVYQYDVLGNRKAVIDNGTTTSYTTNSLNEYTHVGATTCAYDANGNLASEATGGVQTLYGYDSDHDLISVTTPTDTWKYTYDAIGNRSSVTHNGVTTVEVTDPFGLGDLAGEFNANGAVVAQYVQGEGLVGRVDGSGNSEYYAFDGAGSTSEITDPTGAIVDSYAYLPFGEIVGENEAVPNQFKFVGQLGVQENDPFTTWMRNRNYDSATGRFMQPDPTDLAGGDISLYRYAVNDPTALVDPSGLLLIQWSTSFHFWYLGVASNLTYNTDNGTLHSTFGPEVNLGSMWDGGTSLGIYTSDPDINVNFVIPTADQTGVSLGYSNGQLVGMSLGIGPGVGSHVTISKSLGNWVDTSIPIGNPLEWLGNALYDALNTDLPVGGGPTGGGITIGSSDPNAKQGPPGYGTQNAIAAGQPMSYTIYFENDPTATAPVQTAVVTDTLDPTLNPSTVSLGEVTIGQQSITSLAGLASGSATVHLNNSPYDLSIVETTVGNTLQWTFTCFDPSGAPLPITAGFLPPDDSAGDGEGHVTFTVSPSSIAGVGTTVPNTATVVFDQNKPINTNTYTNLVGAALADELIKLPLQPTYSGGGVYATSGLIPPTQVKARTVGAGRSAGYDMELQNTGNIPGSYIVTGPAGSNGWTIAYFDASTGGNNITSAVTGSGWPVPLNPGNVQQYRLEVTPATSVSDGATEEVLVTAAPMANPSIYFDTVEALTTRGTKASTTPVSLDVAAPSDALSGNPVAVYVYAIDQFGNIATDFTGTVTVWSTDIGAAIVQKRPFNLGVGKIAVTFNDPGSYTVTAVDTANSTITGSSNTVSVFSSLTAPTDLKAVAGNVQVSLTWNASANATSYNIYRSTTSTGPRSLLYADATGLSYTDPDVTNGIKYYYQVAAVNGGGKSAKSNVASETPKP